MVTEGSGGETPQECLAELRGVIAKAKAGDTAVLPRLREILDRSPALVTHYGDLARQAEAAWVKLAAGNNLYLKETLVRSAEAQRAELTRPGAQPIEKLLVERVVACSVQLNYFSATEANALAAGDTCRQLQFHSKRVGQAQRMYLAALGALITFQKLTPVPAEGPGSCVPELAESQREPQPSVGTVPLQAARIAVPIGPENDPTEPEYDGRERLRVSIEC